MAFLFKSKKNASGLPHSSRKLASADGNYPTDSQQDGASTPKLPTPISGSQPRGVYSPTHELRNPRERSESSMSGQGRNQRTHHDLSLYPWSQHRLNFVQSGANPFPRYGAAVNAVASLEGDVYLMGGLINGTTVKGDLWIVEAGSGGLECYPVLTQAEGPGPRVGHASLLVGNAFIVFGGDTKIEDHDVLDDTLYLLNTTTKQWTQAAPAGPRPSGRYGHTLNIIGTKIYVFGGQVEGYFCNDLVAFDLNALQTQTARWEVLIQNSADGVPSNGPPARTNHTVITWNDKLYLFGGTDGVNWFNDVWMYDQKMNTWTLQECNGFIPSAREGHAAALVGDHMYVFGGRTEEGKDLGDLAAFRIPTKRWFTFQNMGPSPSPRSGHGMTAFGNQIVILGGEPSSAPSDAKELSLTYVLDTSKIRYPSEHGSQKFSNSRKASIADKVQTPERSASREGQTSNTSRKLSTRASEDSMSSMSHQLLQRGPGLESTHLANTSVSTLGNGQNQRPLRIPPAPGPPGPPPQEAAPQPKANGMKLAYTNIDSRDSPRSVQKTERAFGLEPDVSMRDTNSTKHSPAVRESPQQNPVSPVHLDGARDSPHSGTVSTAVQHSPTDPNNQKHPEKPIRTSSQLSPKQPPSFDNTPRSATTQSELGARQVSQDSSSQTTAPRHLPIDSGVGSSPLSGQKNEDLLKDMEALRSKNSWYASELALARKAGYRSSTTETSISEEKTVNAFGEEEKPMLEALLRMKSELEKVQNALESQSNAAAQKISLVEKQRDAAIAEAVYAKTRMIARDGNFSGADDEGRNTITPDQERSDDAQRRLASALAAQNDLASKTRALTKELEAERQTRQIAEESAEAAHSRAVELDLHKQESTSELERLRSELSQAQIISREQAASYAEILSSSKILEVERNVLSEKLSTAQNDTRSNGKILVSLKEAVSSSMKRADILETKLEEEREEKAQVEEKWAQLRTEHEARVAELVSTSKQLQNTKEMVETYKSESLSYREAVLSGLGKISTGDTESDPSNDERVTMLQQQLEAANTLVRRNQEAADQATERLRRAEERIAGLESYQEQMSREGLNMRKQLQSASRDVLSLQNQNTELADHLKMMQQSTAAVEVQHKALKDLLNDRGIDTENLGPEEDIKAQEFHAERIRELEQQLEASMKAHEDMRRSFEGREREANKGWEDRLAALDNDYQSAVKYFKIAERMVTKMKQESHRYKAQIKELEESLVQERQSVGSPDQDASEWMQERETLKKELEGTQLRLESSAAQLEKEMELVRVAQTERDSLRESSARYQKELTELSESNRLNTEQLHQQNNLLETRAVEAERKVQMLLDTVGITVSNYRRESQNMVSTEESRSKENFSSYRQGMSINSTGENSEHETGGRAANNDGATSDLGRNSVALDSLASELDALRTHWETTSRSYSLSGKAFLDEKSSASDGLTNWRKKLELEEFEGE